MTTPVAAETCPRCAKPLVRNHDELVCLVHGTIATPARAWDAVSEDTDTGGLRRFRGRRSRRSIASAAGTEVRETCPVCGRPYFGLSGELEYCQACGYESPESRAVPAPIEDTDEGGRGMPDNGNDGDLESLSLAQFGSRLIARVKQLGGEIRELEERSAAAIASRKEEGRKLLNVLAAAEIPIPLDAATAIGDVAKASKRRCAPAAMVPCSYCGRECVGPRGRANHERTCPAKAA